MKTNGSLNFDERLILLHSEEVRRIREEGATMIAISAERGARNPYKRYNYLIACTTNPMLHFATLEIKTCRKWTRKSISPDDLEKLGWDTKEAFVEHYLREYMMSEEFFKTLDHYFVQFRIKALKTLTF